MTTATTDDTQASGVEVRIHDDAAPCTAAPPPAPLKATMRRDQVDACPLALVELPGYGTE